MITVALRIRSATIIINILLLRIRSASMIINILL